MRKALVTGGAGFIGSHLVDRLLEEGWKVIVIDNLSTGQIRNIEHHKGNPQLEFHHKDIRDFESIKDLFEGVEWVFHLAALADVVPSIVKPLEYYTTNVTGTANVLEAARLAGVKRFVYTASSSCYGIADVFPTPETAPIRPEYPYALTKWLGEETVFHWGKVYHLPVVSLRFFNIYGPRARTTGTYGAVFGVFLAQKLNNQPYTVVGDGNQSRDFTYVSDAVSALVRAAESDVIQEAINIGSGGHYTINYLVELLGGEKVHIPKRPGEPDCTFADISKAKRLLGWEPRVSFEEGVKKMLEHIDYWRDAPLWTPDKINEATREWFHYLGK